MIAGKTNPIKKLIGKLNHKVRKEIDRVALKAGLKFIINTVLNQEDEIVHILGGDPIQAFNNGVNKAKRIYCPTVPNYVDILIVSSYPADIDYWQAQKALSYASLAVKKGGTIILVTPCPEGIASTHPIYKERATLSFKENLEAIDNNEITDLIGGGSLLMHAQILERAEIICYSDGLTANDKVALGFKSASTIDEAIKIALKSQGKEAKIGVLKCGEILPIVK